MTNEIEQITSLIEGMVNNKVEFLEESLRQKLLALDEVGWNSVFGGEDETSGISLDTLNRIATDLRAMASTHPLFVRGAQLRHAYVFGRGIRVSGLSPRAKKAVANPVNQNVLFSVSAFETMNLAEFTDGNFIVMRDTITDEFTVIPLGQVTGEVTDPDDTSKIRYLRRTWNANGEQKNLWIPTAKYKNSVVGPGKRNGGIQKTISVEGKREKVAQDKVLYIHSTRRQSGWTWGFPISFAAKVFAITYTNYLTDNAELVKSLSKIAWLVTQSTAAGANRAAAQSVAPGIGGTAITGAGNSLQPVGTASSSVDFNKGQPLAALVATTFGVPVIALLSSPGATGGSYGAATTLDLPTMKGMGAVQDSWKVFFEEIYHDLGSKDVVVSFPAIESDPAYRTIASLAQGYESRLLHQDEARDAALEVLDVPRLHEDPPSIEDPVPQGTVSAQGVSGAVAGGTNQGDTDHSGDEDAE